jgi:hypothetical protein
VGIFQYVFRGGTDASSHHQEQLDAITNRACPRETMTRACPRETMPCACPRGALELRSRLVVYRELLINSPQHFTLIY